MKSFSISLFGWTLWGSVGGWCFTLPSALTVTSTNSKVRNVSKCDHSNILANMSVDTSHLCYRCTHLASWPGCKTIIIQIFVGMSCNGHCVTSHTVALVWHQCDSYFSQFVGSWTKKQYRLCIRRWLCWIQWIAFCTSHRGRFVTTI